MGKLRIAIMLIVISFFLFPNVLEASRPYDKRLEPENLAVIDNGIKYIPISYYDSTKGRTFFVQAWDIKVGEKLWEQKIYEIKYDLNLEQDVQDRFVTSLRIENGKLLIKNENNDEYELDLKTKTVMEK